MHDTEVTKTPNVRFIKLNASKRAKKTIKLLSTTMSARSGDQLKDDDDDYDSSSFTLLQHAQIGFLNQDFFLYYFVVILG